MLAALSTGEYKLEFYPVNDANYVAQYYSGKSSFAAASVVTVTAGATTPNINAAMEVGGQITGKVTNASTKAPVSGVTVCPHEVGGEDIYTECANTNANGEYTLVGLGSGDYKVEFYPGSQNYFEQFYNDKPLESEGAAVPVTQARTTAIDAALIVGGEIVGKVTKARPRQRSLASKSASHRLKAAASSRTARSPT